VTKRDRTALLDIAVNERRQPSAANNFAEVLAPRTGVYEPRMPKKRDTPTPPRNRGGER